MKKIIKLTTLLFVLVTLTIGSIVATNQKSNKVTANPLNSTYTFTNGETIVEGNTY